MATFSMTEATGSGDAGGGSRAGSWRLGLRPMMRTADTGARSSGGFRSARCDVAAGAAVALTRTSVGVVLRVCPLPPLKPHMGDLARVWSARGERARGGIASPVRGTSC